MEIALKFGPNWSGAENENDPIPKTRTSRVLFTVKRKETDTDYVLQLSDADEEQINWEDEVNGVIHVFVGAYVKNRMAANSLYWEVKVQIEDSDDAVANKWFVPLNGTGRVNFKKSLVNDETNC